MSDNFRKINMMIMMNDNKNNNNRHANHVAHFVSHARQFLWWDRALCIPYQNLVPEKSDTRLTNTCQVYGTRRLVPVVWYQFLWRVSPALNMTGQTGLISYNRFEGVHTPHSEGNVMKLCDWPKRYRWDRVFSLFRHRSSELPRPIAMWLCHMIGIWVHFVIQVQKFGGPALPLKNLGPFYTTMYQLPTLIAHISGMSQGIQNRKDVIKNNFHPHLVKNSGDLWSINYTVGHLSLDPPKWG